MIGTVRHGENESRRCRRAEGGWRCRRSPSARRTATHRHLLRGPRLRPAGGADPRLPAERAVLGDAGAALLAAGYRVITYDRRGFGKSSQPTIGYDYDTFAADLNALIEQLDLRDVVLVGFSMGTGEVTRYLGTYGSARVRKAVLLGAIPPFLLRPTTTPRASTARSSTTSRRRSQRPLRLLQGLPQQLQQRRRVRRHPHQRPGVAGQFNVARRRLADATYACVDTWLTDFRADLSKIDVPVLVMHGTEDRILPFDSTAKRLPGADRRLRRSSRRGRTAQHRLDPPRVGQPRATRVPAGVAIHSDVAVPARARRQSDRLESGPSQGSSQGER